MRKEGTPRVTTKARASGAGVGLPDKGHHDRYGKGGGRRKRRARPFTNKTHKTQLVAHERLEPKTNSRWRPEQKAKARGDGLPGAGFMEGSSRADEDGDPVGVADFPQHSAEEA